MIRADRPGPDPDGTALLELHAVSVTFEGVDGRERPALDAVDLQVHADECVGLVGANGAGKSTVAWVAAGLRRPDAGVVRLSGGPPTAPTRAARRQAPGRLGLIMQNPFASLPPGVRVLETVAEPLRIRRSADREERARLAHEALDAVALRPSSRFAARYPHELSGGERQRVALARALVGRPQLIIADEPTRMLDPASGAMLIDLMARLRRERGLAILLITHDLATTHGFCDRLVVLDHGRVVEDRPTDDVIARPEHAATIALVDAVRELQDRRPARRTER